MGRTISKMAIWLFLVWAAFLIQGRDTRGNRYPQYGVPILVSLPIASYVLARNCNSPLPFLLFGSMGTLPFSLGLLDDWRMYSALSSESTLSAILGRVCVPVIGMGLLCRAMPALRDFISIEIPNPLCKHCGYNLTGNVSGICPECGTPIPPTSHIAPPNSSASDPPVQSPPS